jgi:hypothetical protein
MVSGECGSFTGTDCFTRLKPSVSLPTFILSSCHFDRREKSDWYRYQTISTKSTTLLVMLNLFQHLSLITQVSFRFLDSLSRVLLLSLPYMSRLYIVRDIYGRDTEGIRDKCGTKGKLVGRKHAVKWALIRVCLGSATCRLTVWVA